MHSDSNSYGSGFAAGYKNVKIAPKTEEIMSLKINVLEGLHVSPGASQSSLKFKKKYLCNIYSLNIFGTWINRNRGHLDPQR
jgi:hypothetical protein